MVHQPQLVGRVEVGGTKLGASPITINNELKNGTSGFHTTELDGEANLTFDGGQLDVGSSGMPPQLQEQW